MMMMLYGADDDNGYEYDDIDWCIAKQWPYNGLLQSLTGGEFGIFCHLLFSYWCFWILKIWHILVCHILPPAFSLWCFWIQRFKDLPHFGLACCPLWLILPPTPFLLPSRYKIGLVSLRLGLLSDFRTFITWWQTFALLIQILELFTWQTEEVKSFLSFDQTSSWLPSQIFSQQDFISSLTKAASTSWVNWDFSSSAKWISQTGSNGFPLRDFSAPRSYLARLCFIPCALLCVCVVPCSTVCVASHTLRDCVWLLAVITATTQPPHGSSSPFSSADDGSKPSVNVRNTGISEPCSLYTTWCKTTRFLCTRSCKGWGFETVQLMEALWSNTHTDSAVNA